ncbi:MAG: allantoinase, partial [Planctomycetota bacterium]
EPEVSFGVEGSFHRHFCTPYEGERLWGRVVATYLRGDLIFCEGEHRGEPRGRVLRKL